MSVARLAWPGVPLGDVCEFKYGKSLPESARAGGKIPVFGSNGQVGSHNKALTKGATIIVGRKGSFGEVNFSTAPCWPIDTTYYVDESATKADLRWLNYRLRALGLNRLNRAAAVPGLNREDAYRQRLLLPPLPEQRRIADILDKADALRAKRRAALAKLDELIQSIFLDMFGDPATNPKGWGVVTLGDVGDVQGGLQLSAKRKSAPREIPYLRVANVYRCALNLDEIKTLSATEAEIARTSLVKDDFLMVEGHGNPAEIGRGALWDGSITHCVHQNHLIRVRFNATHVVPAYAAAYLNSQGGRRHLLRSGKTTSGLNTINVSQVRATPLALPPIELQRSYEHRVRGVERLRGSCISASDGAATLFASLQHRAFRGEL